MTAVKMNRPSTEAEAESEVVRSTIEFIIRGNSDYLWNLQCEVQSKMIYWKRGLASSPPDFDQLSNL